MGKAKQTTYDERLMIVLECLTDKKTYGAMAQKYGCSYGQVRNWVVRYKKMGAPGLEDRRGKRAGTLPSRTPEEALRDNVAKLERENKNLKMENDLLKKVRELEMKDRCL
jgi:transposase-like protein